jgi:monoamine oxidase
MTTRIRAILAAHTESERTGVPVDEILAQRAEGGGRTRRDFLAAGAASAAGLAVAGGLGARPAFGKAKAAAGPAGPSVIVVGAGLAGVRCAHYLYGVKGIAATIYEGSDRVGGRCWTLRDFFRNGQIVEHGGAFIDTGHTDARNLAASLGLTLYESNGGNQKPYGDVYWMDGRYYTYDEANADWKVVARAFRDAAATVPTNYNSYTPAGQALDRMTVNEWIDQNIPGGTSSRFGRLMQTNVISEYGLDPDQQSAINLVYLLGYNSLNTLSPINGSDERFTVVGGNDQLVTRMLDQLPAGTVQHGQKLVAVKQNSNGSVTCTFQSGQRTSDVTADKAVLAIPATMLREVDFSKAGLPPLKQQSIRELSLGANGKLHVQFDRRPWLDLKLGGVAYSDIAGWQTAWDDTAGQAGSSGILCDFPGGRKVTQNWTGTAFGPAPTAAVTQLLQQMEPVFPGLTASYNGLAWRDAWILNPWTKGAYTCPKPGQYTTFYGVESERVGNISFAGEHTDYEYFGFLNGAIRSGVRAAKEVAG